MQSKQNKKTKGNKKYRYTAEEVGAICGCSASYVEKLRRDVVENNDTHMAIKVKQVDEELYNGATALLQAVEEVLKAS